MNTQLRLLLSTLILLLIGWAPDCAHAGNKLFVGGLSWNSSEEALEIELSAHRRLARDGGEYFIASVVHIFDVDGNLVARLLPDPVQIKVRPLQDRVLIKRVEDQVIPWDRNEGSIRGRALVEVMAQVIDRRGRAVNKTESRGFGFVTFDDGNGSDLP